MAYNFRCNSLISCSSCFFTNFKFYRVFSLAVTPDDTNQPPNLRTVGVQRISDAGIDFVMKKGSGTCDSLAQGRPLSFLHLQGRYMPGETAEQWRGEGVCERMPVLQEDILKKLPSYTVVSMVASKRLENEKGGTGEAVSDSFDVSTVVDGLAVCLSLGDKRPIWIVLVLQYNQFPHSAPA